MPNMNVEANRSAACSPRRRALTLVELVVVMAILVVLSSLIVPLIQGLGFQTNAATNATVVDDVNRAMGAYAARTGNQPDGWDSLLNTGGSRFTKLHAALLAGATPNMLQDATLSAGQVKSLNAAGIYNVYDAVESSGAMPSLNHSPTPRRLDDGANGKVVKLTSVGLATLGTEFQVNQINTVTPATYEFIVLGLGSNVNVQGATMMQAPLVQSADPTHQYARVCCVYLVPPFAASPAESFPARYIGCFMPDGTSARKNMENYNSSAVAN